MKIDIGSEKRFFDFIKDLNDKDKIALISHTDMDGLASAKIVNHVVEANVVKFLSYGDLNMNLVQKLKEEKVNKVIFTDLYIEDHSVIKELEKFCNILIIDHHIAKIDLNSPKTVFIKGEEGYCAGYLCYYLFSKVQNIDVLDWIAVCSSISDFCNVKNSDWIRKVHEKYNEPFTDDMVKVGFDENDFSKSKFYEYQWIITLGLIYYRDNLNKAFNHIGNKFGDIGDLREKGKEVQKEIEQSVIDFEKKKISISKGYFWEFRPKYGITSIVINLVSQRHKDKNLVIIRDDDGVYRVSARRQDRGDDMNVFLKKLLEGLDESSGGGHVPAAGGFFPARHLKEFKKRLGILS